MKVVLLQNVTHVGQSYDVVNVKPGFARNFLFPRRFARPATAQLIAKSEKVRAERVKKMEELLKNAKALVETLKGITLTFTKKARGESLYGSIGAKDVMAALAEQAKIELPKETIHLKSPIKTLGEHTIKLHLAEGVDATVKVVVAKEE